MKKATFIGQKVGHYKIERLLGEGAVGEVYLGVRHDIINDERAFKFIKHNNLRENWENEINKVTKIQTVEGVVPYFESGDISNNSGQYKWIAWKFIPGKSLRALCDSRQLNIPLVCDVLRTLLAVLHACRKIKIQHGDLHAGNILIEDSNELSIIEGQRKVWVTDFGYLSASQGKDMLDDYMGIIRIIRECLRSLKTDFIKGADKKIFLKLETVFLKKLSETDTTQGPWVRNPRQLLKELNKIEQNFESENNSNASGIGDYLAAETIGDRYEVWKNLFVPVFAGSDDLLSRNICVLTGLRGCGKTMVFRRLTALYDMHLGPANIKNANTFLGLYVNARHIAEAFPWLPDEKIDMARDQVIHFFHASWSIELFAWLKILSKKHNLDMTWLAVFFDQHLQNLVYTSNENVISQLESRIVSELDASRLTSGYNGEDWSLRRLDFLELLVSEVASNLPSFCDDKMFYLFLDDYSMPMVSEGLQRILNPIVFRRSSVAIFKIATESIESLIYVGLNNKTLEQEDDFILIDSGSQSMIQSEKRNQEIISMILQPRIDMDSQVSKNSPTLTTILGTNTMSNNGLAKTLRLGRAKTKTLYWGKDFFVRLWSSNTRELIELFSRLVEAGKINSNKSDANISFVTPKDQDSLFRDAGARYLDLLSASMDPTSEKLFLYNSSDKTYGRRLREIADAFQTISRYELINKDSKNQDLLLPKQARRIEITDQTKDLPEELAAIYKGLIRYGLFIRDIRGKSVRGKPNPRHYVRSILIPFYTITFSKRDSISLSWGEFCELLENPVDFSKNWEKNQKRAIATKDSGQSRMDFSGKKEE